MHRRRRKILVTLAILLLGGLLVGGWYLLLDGRAPPRRPDLVRLPEDAPPAPEGYPTENAVMAAYLLGLLSINESLEVETPADVVERLDVVYGETPQQPLTLDLYSPREREGLLPGLIFFHGGGWHQGDKRDERIYALPMVQQGYVAACAGYRFTTVAPHPAQVEDAKCAVRWMRKNAARLGVDPERIGVVGNSAGGYLALMLGLTGDDPAFEGTGGHAGVSSAVQAVVDIYGPVDLTTPFAREHETVRRFLQQPYAGHEQLYARASPITHVDARDPPILIIQGTVDSLVKVTQSDALAERLQQLGVPYWYDRLDGWPHSMDLETHVFARCRWLMRRFLATQLRSPEAGDPDDG